MYEATIIGLIQPMDHISLGYPNFAVSDWSEATLNDHPCYRKKPVRHAVEIDDQ